MNCIDLKQPKVLMDAFALQEETAKRRIYNCFRELYYDYFIKFSHKTIFIRHSFCPENAEELLNDSFVDGYVAFYLYINKNGFENRGSVDTAFLEFCKRTLWAHIKRQDKHNRNRYTGDPEIPLNQSANSDPEDSESKKEIKEEWEKRYSLFEKAFQMLGERCQNLITWRKKEKLSNEEIAIRSGIKENIVTNEIYRCCEKLKKIIEGLK